MKQLIEYAKSFLGVTYIWGGNHPAYGYDCSGLVQEILASVGVDPKGDQTAQALHDYFLVEGDEIWGPKTGALIFYGKSKEHITHVSFCISPYQVIEAGGGDSSCTGLSRSIAMSAFVRLRPVDHRSDVLAYMLPRYGDWVKQLELPLG
jgi:peptidoglycan endopeptidase LytE